MLWEALGGAREVPLVTVGLLLALICQADFVAKTSFVFWLLDKYATFQHSYDGSLLSVHSKPLGCKCSFSAQLNARQHAVHTLCLNVTCSKAGKCQCLCPSSASCSCVHQQTLAIQMDSHTWQPNFVSGRML